MRISGREIRGSTPYAPAGMGLIFSLRTEISQKEINGIGIGGLGVLRVGGPVEARSHATERVAGWQAGLVRCGKRRRFDQGHQLQERRQAPPEPSSGRTARAVARRICPYGLRCAGSPFPDQLGFGVEHSFSLESFKNLKPRCGYLDVRPWVGWKVRGRKHHE